MVTCYRCTIFTFNKSNWLSCGRPDESSVEFSSVKFWWNFWKEFWFKKKHIFHIAHENCNNSSMLLGLLSNLGFYGLNGPSSDLIKNQIDEKFA